MSIRAVIFDMGGVLLRDMDKAPRQRQAARLGVDEARIAHLVFDSESARLATVGAIPVAEHWEQVRQALGLPAQEIGEFVREYFAGDMLDMQLVEVLRSLRGHVRIGLLSNAFDDARQSITDRWGIADAFDVMVFSAEVRLVKPDPRIYRLALDRLGAAPGETLFVDDVAENVQAAREVGMQGIQFVSPDETLGVLKTLRVWGEARDNRAVYWDVGGVILRTVDRSPREQLAARLGVTRQALEELVFASPLGRQVQLGQATIAQLWAHVAQIFALSPEGLAAFQEAFWGGDRLDMDLVDYIRTLHGRCRTGVISNGWPNLRQNLLGWGVADAFDTVVVSAETGVMKPDPRIYRLALERLAVQPAEAVFVDDFIENVEGARRAGMLAVHFRDPLQARVEIESLLIGN